MVQTYKVTTEGDVEGRSTKTLGYATGNPTDIQKFYEDRMYYSIKVEPITIEVITPQAVMDRITLLKRERDLEDELKRVKSQL